MKKKVSFVVGSGYGGAERMTFLYANLLLNNGFDCNALILQNTGTLNTVSSYIPTGLTCFVTISRFRFMIFYLFKFLRREKPDYVFCSMPDRSALLLLLKKYHFYNGKVIIRDNSIYRYKKH